MKQSSWNEGWKFWEEGNSFALVWNIPENAKEVTLPHDAMMEHAAFAESRNGNDCGYRDGAVYVYVKQFTFTEEELKKPLFAYFEGIYQNAMFYLNGEACGINHYGYSGFLFPLNEFAKAGEDNELRIIVRNSAPKSGRWYTGGGIYRNVWLLAGEEVYIKHNLTRVLTEELTGAEGETAKKATLYVAQMIANASNETKQANVVYHLLDADGNQVLTKSIIVLIPARGERLVDLNFVVENANLWSAEHPYLYTLKTEVGAESQTTAVGIRTVTAASESGLLVNGEEVKLRGGCMHHDLGLLGSTDYYEARVRQIRILKEAGFNALRMAHNPASDNLLRACDELGMYVMDEAFDMWTRGKTDNDYALYFESDWEKDLTKMVRKDFAHPSVILYSLGNEVPELSTVQGARILKKLHDKVKEVNPKALTMLAVNGIFAAGNAIPKIMGDVVAGMQARGEDMGNVNNFMQLMDSHLDEIVCHKEISKVLEHIDGIADVIGYNYMTARQAQDGKDYPNRVIVGSETYPPEIDRNWKIIQENSHVLGDFTWCGWDYIGEAGVGVPAYNWGEGGFGAVFPCQLAFVGDIDITGFRRPASYYREAVFGLRKDPYIAVQDPVHFNDHMIATPWVMSDSYSSWTHPSFEEKTVIVEVYNPGASCELFLNGATLGKKEGLRVLFETTYAPGELKAVSYDENGAVLGEYSLHTATGEKVLHIEKEDVETVTGDPKELDFYRILVTDANGNLFDEEETVLTLETEHPEDVLGFGSADPKSKYHYRTNVTETYHGRAQLIVKSGAQVKVTI